MQLRLLYLLPVLCLPACTSVAQSSAPMAAPGLQIPGGSLPYALDRFEGKLQLVPIHHTSVEVNNHKGANVAGSLAGSFFYKPKMTVEVAGAHARTVLHDPSPALFVHLMEDPDGEGNSPSSESPSFAIVHATVDKDRRIFAQVRFTQLTGNAKRNEGIVETTTERLPSGWIKLTPKAPLTPGEYALDPIPTSQSAFSTVVFDFRLDPAAPNAADAVKPAP